MKKITISLLLILICYLGYGQFGITQNLGSSSTLVNVPANGGLRGGLINRVFVDTSSANLSQLDFYDGAQIKTLSPINALWWRDSTNMKWVQVLPPGGTIGTFAWNVGGNSFFPAASGNFVFGIGATTTGNYGIDFRTKNTTRLILDSNGIVRSSNAANVALLFDSVTKVMYYGTAGGGTTDWSITGNSGTTAGTNFVGTTDAVDLVFKINSVKSGLISTLNTAFGYRSLLANTTGEDNIGYGHYSLTANTSGSGNIGIGVSSLNSNTTGGNNTAVGNSSLAQNNASGNTAFGNSALSVNSTGNDNTGIGANSLGAINSGSNNIGLGSSAGNFLTTESNRLVINSLSRVNKLGDTTQSIIYGAQDATAANQRLYFNSQVYLPYANAGAGTKALRINPGTGIITYADTTTSSGGTVTSVALAVPSPASPAFTVSGSPVTGSGTLTISANGTTSQYVRGDGSLATTPTGTVSTATLPLSISGSNISMTKASSTDSGWVSIGTQTFAGNKSFLGQLTTGTTGTTGKVSLNRSSDGGNIADISGGTSGLLLNGANVVDLQLGGFSGTRFASTGLYVSTTAMGAASSTSTLQTAGSFATAYRAITALRTLDATDHTINCTSGTFTVTLPTAASITGREYVIVNSGSGTITIGTTSSQTFTNINGTPTTLTLAPVGAGAIVSYTVVSNGANWIVTAKVKDE